MVLLNRELVPFSLCNNSDAPILPFDSIVALANGYHNATCFRDGDAPDTVRVDLPPIFNTRFLYEAFKMELDPYLKNDADYVGESHRTYVRGVAYTWRWRKRMEMPIVGGPRGGFLAQVKKLFKRGTKKQKKHETDRDTVDFDNEVDRPYVAGGSPIVPKGPSELICLLRLTRLDELLSLSRVDVIWAGNSRYCKRNRAVAIMSAVGATDWFQRQCPSRDEPKGDLILDKYPRAFLEEIVEKMGALFFFHNTRFFDLMKPLCVFQHGDGTLQEVRIVHGQGTLLPVAVDLSQFCYLQVFDISSDLVDHPSVRSWRLLQSGGFHLPEIGVLAVSEDDGRVRSPACSIRAWVSGPAAESGISPGRSVTSSNVDLRTYLRSFMPGMFKIAVVLMTGPQFALGIILLEREIAFQGLPGTPEQGQGAFVKVGLFKVYGDYPFLESQVVNWRVL